MKLNLGSGRDYKEGFINIDYNKNLKAEVYHDLREMPYPFKDNTFSYIYASHIIEHFREPLDVLKELWRISKHKGIIHIKVPHWSYVGSVIDLTHRSYYSALSFNQFKEKDNYYNDKTSFGIKEIKLNTLYKKSGKIGKIGKIIDKIMFPILNFSLGLTEKLLCKFIPVHELEIKLEVLKDNN